MTRDLDLLALGQRETEPMVKIFGDVCAHEVEHDGLIFDAERIVGEPMRGDLAYGGFRLRTTARLASAVIPLQIDIGFGDVVHGLLSSHGGRDFEIVLKPLDELGYGVAWRVLNSKDFGVPQQRRRVYVVAIHRDRGGPGKVLFEPKCGGWNTAKSRPNGKKAPSLFQTIIGNSREGPLVKSIAHCIYAESARHTGTDWSRNYVWYPDGRVRRLTPVEVERAQGFPDNWTLPRVVEEKQARRIDSLRYHAIGNAVTPPVAEWVGMRLATVMATHDSEHLQYLKNDRELRLSA